MRVLVIHQQLPVPPMDGGRLRRLQHLDALGADHDLTIVGRCPDKAGGERFRRDHEAWRVIEVPEAPDRTRSLVTRTVRDLTARERFDAVHVSGLAQWPGERPIAGARVVLDIENVDTTVLRHMRDTGDQSVSAFEVEATDALLRETCRRADLVVSCSEPDAAELRRLAPDARVAIVPNGVDTSFFAGLGPPPRQTPRVITFVGLLAYWPNADACVYFVREILPLVEARIGAVRFQIVGRVPPESVAALADGDRVRLAADVPDVRPWLAASDVLVVPLRAGSGTRLKILEGLAAGRPVVSTSIGCEGLDAVGGRHLLVADGPQAFADAVARAVCDETLADALVRDGLSFVRERYDVPVVHRSLRQLYREIENR